MPTKEFDPLAYIENAFEEKSAKSSTNGVAKKTSASQGSKFRKTKLSAPRPRKAASSDNEPVLDEDLKFILENLPKNIEFLGTFFTDSVTSKYYQGDFKETREDLIRRLLNPELTLEEASRLLGVCPATVRRYTNRGWLGHHRTKGGQRRFRLSGIVKFVEEHGRLPEE
ncbi:MAG: helix-turn-helix domain-containing protein [Fimbriimonadaceae bacterium]